MERIFVFLRSPGAATSVLLGATVLALILANFDGDILPFCGARSKA